MFQSRARRRGLTAVFALSSALAMAGTAAATELRQAGERVFPFHAGGAVAVHGENGPIRVEAWDRTEVRVQITRIARGRNRDKAEALMRELRADVTVQRDRIEIDSHTPQRSASFWDLLDGGDLAEIEYVVQVPARTRLELRTVNGAIHVAGTSGDLEVQGTNGAINLRGIDGSARAQTTNGAIEAGFRKIPAQGWVELTTTNGAITVALPPDLKANLDANTTNGHVSGRYPFERTSRPSSRSVRGTAGAGGVPVTLRTTNGAIVIRTYRT